MRFLTCIFALLVGVAVCTPIPYSLCAKDDLLKINTMDGTPWPPKLGANFTIDFDMDLTKDVNDGTYYVKAKALGITVFKKSGKFSDSAEIASLLPIKAGKFADKLTIPLPKLPVSSKVTVHLDLKTDAGEELLCMDLTVKPKTLVASSNDQYEFFSHYMTHFGKEYESEGEYRRKFANFRETLKRVEQKNEYHVRTGGEEDVFGLTRFSDLSTAEFKGQYLMADHPQPTPAIVEESLNQKDIDWRDNGAVTRMKDQGQCGSCWAFSALNAIESHAFLHGGYELYDLSAEQIASCTYKHRDGCNGGDPPQAYVQMHDMGGVMTEQDWSYTSGTSMHAKDCDNFDAKKAAVQVKDHKESHGDLEDMLAYGPMSICVAADAWQDYTGGILSNCPGQIDHCVQAVGVVNSAPTPYWIVRNQWGAGWGDKGYLYIKKEGNVCHIQDEITYPTF